MHCNLFKCFRNPQYIRDLYSPEGNRASYLEAELNLHMYYLGKDEEVRLSDQMHSICCARSPNLASVQIYECVLTPHAYFGQFTLLYSRVYPHPFYLIHCALSSHVYLPPPLARRFRPSG